jgi:hypothetical protein
MSGTRKVIAWKALPPRSPLGLCVLYALALDKIKAPQWAWGAYGVVVIISWVTYFVSLYQTKEIDIWGDK